MLNSNILKIISGCMLLVAANHMLSVEAEDQVRRYDYAQQAFTSAQRAEDTARFSSYALNKSDYYQMATENYKLAIKEAQRSIEDTEQLSRSEEYNRERIIDISRARIEVCEERHQEARVILEVEELKRQGYKYVIAGFNYATADDKQRAKRSWREAKILYEKALALTKDIAEQEVIRSKLIEIEHYIERYLWQVPLEFDLE